MWAEAGLGTPLTLTLDPKVSGGPKLKTHAKQSITCLEKQSQIRKLRMWIQIQHPNRQKLLRSMVGIRKWDGRETGTMRCKHMMIGFLLVLLISPTFWPCPAQCLCDLSPSSKTLKFSNVPGFCLRSFSSLNSYPLPGWSHSVAWL